MGKLERLDAHRARMEAWLRNCFLAGNPLVSVQIRSSFGTHRITAENSHEKAVTAQGSQAKSLFPEFSCKGQEFFQKSGFDKKT